MAGILDFYNDPSSAGILSLASGMMDAGGPQRFPVSLGQALGQGFNQSLRTTQAIQSLNLQRQLQQQQIIGAMLGNRMMGWKANLLDSAEEGPQAQAAPAGPVPTTQADVAPGGNANPNGMPAWASQAIQSGETPSAYTAPQQAAPQASGGYGIPQLPGVDPRTSALIAAGVLSPAYASALTSGPNALLAKGYVPDGKGGWMMSQTFAQGQGQVTGAQEAAKFPYAAMTSLARYAGRPVTYNPYTTQVAAGFDFLPASVRQQIMGAVSGIGGGGAAPAVGGGAAPQGAPVASAPSAAVPNAGTGGRPGLLSPLQLEAQKAHANELESESKSLREAANNAVQANYSFDQMSNALNGFKPGPGTNIQMWLEKNLSMLGKPFGIEPPKNLGNYQEFTKYANQVAFAATKQLGSREAAQIVQMQIESNPNAELNPEAVKGLITSMHSMNDYIIAKSQAEQQWRGTHGGTTDGFNSYWQSTTDPRAWQLGKMTSQEQTKFVNALSPSDAAKLKQKIMAARTNGWLQ